MNTVTGKENLIAFIAVSIMFLSGIIQDDYTLLIEFAVLLLMIRRLQINRHIMMFTLLIFFAGFLNVLIGRSDAIMLLKQLIGVMISYLFYFSAISEQNCGRAVILAKKMSVCAAVIGIIQQIAFQLGISFIYDLRWLVPDQHNMELIHYRSYSLYTEPSQFALILMPFTFIAVYRLTGRYRHELKLDISIAESVIIILGFLFTFSSAGYAGLFFGLFLIMNEYGIGIQRLGLILLGIFGLIFLYQTVPAFSDRLSEMAAAVLGDTSRNIGVSPQTLIDHFRISFKDLFHTYGLGSGIGSYEIVYYQYADPSSNAYLVNSKDGGSLFFRLIAETGLAGTVLVFGFFYKYWSRKQKKCRIISMACLTYMFMKFLRFGHYFGDGTWLIIVLYYRIGIISKKSEGSYESFNYYHILQQCINNRRYNPQCDKPEL